jgi:hypothetical protein
MLALGFLALSLWAPGLRAQETRDQEARDQLGEAHGLLLQIEHEIAALQRHFGSKAVARPRLQQADWQPRHIWHKAYGVQIQINIFRRQHGLFGIAPVALEPGVRVTAPAILGQLHRALTELRILCMLLKVETTPAPPRPPVAVELDEIQQHLTEVSNALDALNGEAISSSYVYAEAMRLESDLVLILSHLGIDDRAVPPPALAQASSNDLLRAAYDFMLEIQRLQQRLGLSTTDFSALAQGQEAQPEDTFNMLILCLAEIQPLKMRLGLAEAISPPAVYRPGKTPVQVTQLLGYMVNQMRLIHLD